MMRPGACLSALVALHVATRGALSQETAAGNAAVGGDVLAEQRCYAHTINGHTVKEEPTRAVWAKPMETRGGMQYVSGTRTWDTLRYAKTKRLPLCTRFTDRLNFQHQVCIRTKECHFTMYAPISNEVRWYGDERDRTGIDARAILAEYEFSYREKEWFLWPHGIRVRTAGFAPGNTKIVGDAPVDTAFRYIGQSMEIGRTVADITAGLAEIVP